MKKLILWLLAVVLTAPLAARSQDMVTDHNTGDDFPIVTPSAGAVPIYVDPKDHWLVRKTAACLQDDIERVTGLRPPIITDLPSPRQIPFLIIIGSMDQSPLVQQLARQNMIPASLTGKWESYILKTIRQACHRRRPCPAHHRQRPPGYRLRRVRTVPANGRIALVLVGRCPGSAPKSTLRQ